MRAVFRITNGLLRGVHEDLSRPHAFAAERVGFLTCRVGALSKGHLILAESYRPVEDCDYRDVQGYGAMMGPGAIRKALQAAYREKLCMFHVHRHEHHGLPKFSQTDVTENAKFVPDFFKVGPRYPHGALVLSLNAISGAWWDPDTRMQHPIDEISVVGRPMWTWWRKPR